MASSCLLFVETQEAFARPFDFHPTEHYHIHPMASAIDLFDSQHINFAFQRSSRISGTSDNVTIQCNSPVFILGQFL